MKSFGKGFFTGIVTTVGVVAGAVYAFKTPRYEHDPVTLMKAAKRMFD